MAQDTVTELREQQRVLHEQQRAIERQLCKEVYGDIDAALQNWAAKLSITPKVFQSTGWQLDLLGHCEATRSKMQVLHQLHMESPWTFEAYMANDARARSMVWWAPTRDELMPIPDDMTTLLRYGVNFSIVPIGTDFRAKRKAVIDDLTRFITALGHVAAPNGIATGISKGVALPLWKGCTSSQLSAEELLARDQRMRTATGVDELADKEACAKFRKYIKDIQTKVDELFQ